MVVIKTFIIFVLINQYYIMDNGTILKNNKELRWTLLNESKESGVDKLFELYGKDKEKARIYYYLNKSTVNFIITRMVLFEYENGDFRVAKIVEKIGISSTGKMYTSKKTIEAISYTKRGGFYYFDNKNGRGGYIKQLTYQLLGDFSRQLTTHGVDEVTNGIKALNPVIDYMTNRFGWIRYVIESLFWSVTFNVINRKKLFNLKAMCRHIYGCPYPQAKIIHEHIRGKGHFNYLGVWKEQKKVLINIESLTKEFFYNPLFSDSCRMAQMVGKKVNCSWSENRLKSEHDNWSKVVTQVLLESEDLRDLNISPIFSEFAEYSGFELLLTNHALLGEGVRMNHCVGTYSNMVDNGQCAIYRVLGCTLELRVSVLTDEFTGGIINKLIIGQYMDFGNTIAPQESWYYVNGVLDGFKPSFYSTLVTDSSLF